MSLIINTNPTLTVYAGANWSYVASGAETNPAWSGTSAVSHASVSAVRGPVAFDSSFAYISGSDATFTIKRRMNVSDIQLSAIGNESFDLTLTMYSTSGTYVNQDISVSASFSPAYSKRTNVGTGLGSTNGGDISDFYQRGLGTKG